VVHRVQVSENFHLKCDYDLSYVGKYDTYKVKLLLLRLVAEMSSHVALNVQFCSAYLSPDWIGYRCLCCVVYRCQKDMHLYKLYTLYFINSESSTK